MSHVFWLAGDDLLIAFDWGLIPSLKGQRWKLPTPCSLYQWTCPKQKGPYSSWNSTINQENIFAWAQIIISSSALTKWTFNLVLTNTGGKRRWWHCSLDYWKGGTKQSFPRSVYEREQSSDYTVKKYNYGFLIFTKHSLVSSFKIKPRLMYDWHPTPSIFSMENFFIFKFTFVAR